MAINARRCVARVAPCSMVSQIAVPAGRLGSGEDTLYASGAPKSFRCAVLHRQSQINFVKRVFRYIPIFS